MAVLLPDARGEELAVVLYALLTIPGTPPQGALVCPADRAQRGPCLPSCQTFRAKWVPCSMEKVRVQAATHSPWSLCASTHTTLQGGDAAIRSKHIHADAALVLFILGF